MRMQIITYLTVSSPAFLTYKWLFPRVNSHVHCETLFFAGMYSTMQAQMTRLTERFSTLLTSKRFFTGVDAQAQFEVS